MPAKTATLKSAPLKGAPVKVSARLVAQAKTAALAADRSLAAQIEHWSRIGQQVELLLPHQQLMQIKANEASELSGSQRAVFTEMLLGLLNGGDRAAAHAVIQAGGKPVYEADPARADRIRQVWPDGRRISGRLVGRKFVPEPA